jgi:hypothetical protein
MGIDITVGREGLNTVYVTGVTSSNDFPITRPQAYNSDKTVAFGLQDIFVSRLANDLATLVNSTWLGGTFRDDVNSIVQSSINNDIYITGFTESADYPVSDGCFASTNSGVRDAIISVFNESLSQLNASTYIGGKGTDEAYCIRTDNEGNIVITGNTDSADYPVWPISGDNPAFDTSFNINLSFIWNSTPTDTFVLKITNNLNSGFVPPPTNSPPENPNTGGSSGDPFASPDAFTKQFGTCFIATAVYGSPTHPNVVTLQNFRDKYLLTNSLGSKFVKWYYEVSPGIADYLRTSPFKASMVRFALTPLVYVIRYPALLIAILLLSLLFIIRIRKLRDSIST